MQTVVGLLGALAGAAAVAAAAWWNQRYSARSKRRNAARTLLGEAAALQRRVDHARADRVALTGVGSEVALLLDVWRTNPDLGELPFGIWKTITGRVHSIQMTVADAEHVGEDGWSRAADHTYSELSDMLGVIVGALEIASR